MAYQNLPGHTIVDRLLSHPEKVHFTFDHGDGNPRYYSGISLAEDAAGLASRFRELGVEPGDRIAVVLPTSEALIRTIVAAWMARAIIVVLPHRLDASRSGVSSEKLARMLASISPKIVVAHEAVESATRCGLGPGQFYLAAEGLHDLPKARIDSILRPIPSDMAVLQFSSGSTNDPRAVIVRHGQLMENTISSGAGAGVANDVISLWLPLYHDFGMLGAIYFPLVFGLSVSLMPTESFILSPVEWLRMIEKYRATLTALPPFALGIIAAAAARLPIGALDLSSMSYISVGSEPIFPSRVTSASLILERHGLSPRAFQPAYGMAEAVAGITNGERGSSISVVAIDERAWRVDGSVIMGGEMQVVGCGRAIEKMSIRIVQNDGKELPQPRRGQVLISGPSITDGYWSEEATPLADGWLATGDEGFLLDGQLYICGRSKDTLIRGGINFDAHEIENLVETLMSEIEPSLGCRAVVVFSVRDDLQQRERAIAVVEVSRCPEESNEFFNRVRKSLIDRVGFGLDDIAYALPPGLPRTTSGKLQRSRARDIYELGVFSA